MPWPGGPEISPNMTGGNTLMGVTPPMPPTQAFGGGPTAFPNSVPPSVTMGAMPPAGPMVAGPDQGGRPNMMPSIFNRPGPQV